MINTLQLAAFKNLIQMSLQYVHFRATNFHWPVFVQQLRKAWSYSTPRVFEEFQQKFPDFQGTYPTESPESLQMRKHVYNRQVTQNSL
jgi:hypothetical protein